jgi:hypothetical protein
MSSTGSFHSSVGRRHLRERLDLVNRLADLVDSELKADQQVTTLDLTGGS